MKVVYNNKGARHSYEIIRTYEAGIVLKGWEVKAIKKGKASFGSSYIKDKNLELFLNGAKLYNYFGGFKQEETRQRKLILHKSQIANIVSKLKQPGFTAIPLRIYVNDKRLIKVEIAVVKGKKKFQKKEKKKKRDLEKQIEVDRKNLNI
jgi:SsrA-binding protein